MKTKKQLRPDQKERMYKLFTFCGATMAELARMFDCDKTTVWRTLKKQAKQHYENK